MGRYQTAFGRFQCDLLAMSDAQKAHERQGCANCPHCRVTAMRANKPLETSHAKQNRVQIADFMTQMALKIMSSMSNLQTIHHQRSFALGLLTSSEKQQMGAR
jgi:hypothetical protein